MSAIHGIFRFDGTNADPAGMTRQANALARAGHDRRESWHSGPIGLGHLLRRVTVEDRFDAQPVQGEHHCLVADLRLDNREELARALSIGNDALAALSDSHVLLKAFEQWGEACVDRLVGDFAFAVWDARAQKLTLARDPMGQRHLFYHHGADQLVFASDPRGLWAVEGVPETLSDLGLAKTILLDAGESDGATLFEGVSGLTGGTLLSVDREGRRTTRKYWVPHADPAHLGKDEAYYRAAYRRVLAEAVACRVRRAIHPPGLFLGGGFDSGAIAGLAGPALAAHKHRLVTISSVLPEGHTGPLRDIRSWAEMIARDMPHVDLRYVTHETTDPLAGMEREFMVRGSPYSPNGLAISPIHQRFAESGVRVVMNGYGGDYTLNPRVNGWLGRLLWRGEWLRFARELRPYARHHRVTLARAIRSEVAAPIKAHLRHRLRRGRLDPGRMPPLAGPFLGESLARGVKPFGTHRFAPGTPMATRMIAQLEWQQGLAAMGGAQPAAAYGLELTQPFHDKRVVELALAIPEALQARGGRNRHLARGALADVYPAEFQARDSRNDSMVPDIEAVIDRALPQLLAEIARMEQNPRLTRYFDFAKIRRLLDGSGERKSRRDGERRRGLLSFTFARFVEWQARDNDRGG